MRPRSSFLAGNQFPPISCKHFDIAVYRTRFRIEIHYRYLPTFIGSKKETVCTLRAFSFAQSTAIAWQTCWENILVYLAFKMDRLKNIEIFFFFFFIFRHIVIYYEVIIFSKILTFNVFFFCDTKNKHIKHCDKCRICHNMQDK